MMKKTKITNTMLIIFLTGFFLTTFLLPGKSYLIKSGIFAGPISAAKLLTASISRITNTENNHYNILILGVPGEPNNAPYLTDTIIIAQISKSDKKTTINTISLPRDLLVEQKGTWRRINSLYANGKSISHKTGISGIQEKTEKITGVKMTHYILVDIAGLKSIVNKIDGVNIMVPRDIYDPLFPGPSDSYETFEIKKGWRYLDGDLASRYIRTRNDAESDFGRMKRQIQVIKAIKDKMFSLNPIWNLKKFLSILKTLSDSVKTDLGFTEIIGLWEIMNTVDFEEINHIIIDTDLKKKLITEERVMLDNDIAAVLVPMEGVENYGAIKKYISDQLKSGD